MVVGSNSYADQGRAKVEARNAGVVRVYANRDRGVIKGACLFGPGMDHIAHLFAWAIERSETASALLQLPFYHPMFEEGLKTALREICEAVGSSELKGYGFRGGSRCLRGHHQFELVGQERCWPELVGSNR
jgi:dihydrolipoamide dehydrogenase